ncbi:hypothetical protein D3C85_1186460 [compost metagenome]
MAAYRGFGCAQTARLPLSHRAVLINSHPHALHCTRQSAYQFRRVNSRHVRGINAAIRFGNANLLRQLFRAQPAVIAFVEALFVELVQILAKAGFLFGIPGGAVQRPTLAIITVDAFTFEDNFHFIGDLVQHVVRGAALLGG